MGLDWMLQKSRPMNGYSTEYGELTAKLDELENDEGLTEDERLPLRRDLVRALERVSVSAYAIIEAPRIGVDECATDWFRKHVYGPNQARSAEETARRGPSKGNAAGVREPSEPFVSYWGRAFDEVLKDETGKWVPALAKKTEVLAEQVGMFCSAIDFRGKAVEYAVVIAEELRNEAYDDHDPEQCVDYADRLEASLASYRELHPDWADRTEMDSFGSAIAVRDDIDAVESAIRWLRFWGANGFGFSPWF